MSAAAAERPLSGLRLRPVSLAEARAFIVRHHRHNRAPVGWRLGVGATYDGELVGVATAGRPVARMLDDGFTLEVTRVCTTGERNCCSLLYAAICRAARALGYHRVITYTLASESGSALRGAGFELVSEVAGADHGWDMPQRPRYECDLFGEALTPIGYKRRWERRLTAVPEDVGQCVR